jgi:hypothetical protein
MKEFAIAGFIFIVVKGADIWTTSLYTPDFSQAASPLNGVLPIEWFFTAQALISVVSLVGIYVYTNRSFKTQPAGLSYAQYWNRTLYDRDNVGLDWLTKLPKDKTQLLQLIAGLVGFVSIFVLIPFGALVTASNLLCYSNAQYLEFFTGMGKLLIKGLGTILALGSIPLYLYTEYRKYRRNGSMELIKTREA